jgi:peptide/nickel transport system permease protein
MREELEDGLDFLPSVIAYVLRRLCLAGSIVVAVSLAGFVGFGLSFDPAFSLVTAPSKRAFVRAYYHLNDPILSQYWRWVRGLFRHGFGTTVSTDVTGTVPPQLGSSGVPIGPAVWHAAAITFELVGAALVIVIVGSAAVAAVAARRRRFRSDLAARFLVYLGAAVPTFLVGDLLVHAINPQYAQVVVGGHATITSTGSWFVVGPPTGGFVNWLRHMTLPVVALAVSLIGIYARYLRSAIVSTLSEPYVAVARAKGLSERRLMLRHVLRNSLIPFTSLLSLEIGAVIGASLAADAVFNLGGLASTFLGAVHSADPFELTALFVTTAVVVSAFTLLGDVLVGVLDPRVSVLSSRTG